MSPKFSIIIPVYNKVDTLERAMRSALAQRYPAYEIICIDDGSTDGSAEILDTYLQLQLDTTTIRVVHQTNAGVSAARNAGINLALGDFISFLDADDIWLPYHLEDLRDIHNRQPDAKILSTRYARKESTARISANDSGYEIINLFECLHAERYVNMDTICIERNLLFSVGGFDRRYSYYEDWELFYRLAERVNSFVVAKRVSAIYLDDSAFSAHTGPARPLTDYGHFHLGEEKLANGSCSISMQKCLIRAFANRLPSIVVRRQWETLSDIIRVYPNISHRVPALHLLRYGNIMRPYVWLVYAFIALRNRYRERM